MIGFWSSHVRFSIVQYIAFEVAKADVVEPLHRPPKSAARCTVPITFLDGWKNMNGIRNYILILLPCLISAATAIQYENL